MPLSLPSEAFRRIETVPDASHPLHIALACGGYQWWQMDVNHLGQHHPSVTDWRQFAIGDSTTNHWMAMPTTRSGSDWLVWHDQAEPWHQNHPLTPKALPWPTAHTPHIWHVSGLGQLHLFHWALQQQPSQLSPHLAMIGMAANKPWLFQPKPSLRHHPQLPACAIGTWPALEELGLKTLLLAQDFQPGVFDGDSDTLITSLQQHQSYLLVESH